MEEEQLWELSKKSQQKGVLREFDIRLEYHPSLRLCRLAVRKGCAFPLTAIFISGKAALCRLRGVASQRLEKPRTERHSLSARQAAEPQKHTDIQR
jgi:hypothetical protein